jgi:hypothetical protein
LNVLHGGVEEKIAIFDVKDLDFFSFKILQYLTIKTLDPDTALCGSATLVKDQLAFKHCTVWGVVALLDSIKKACHGTTRSVLT